MGKGGHQERDSRRKEKFVSQIWHGMKIAINLDFLLNFYI